MLAREVAYPSQDGRPLAESDVHRRLMRDLVYGLRHHYRDRNDVFVGGAVMTFYEEGNPRKFVAPDVSITFGVDRRKRDKYLIWKEGKVPDVVIELTSQSTKTEDLVMKKNLYARLYVKEYYIFDPMRNYLPNGLMAFDLIAGEYVSRIDQPLISSALGLELRVEDQALRLYDPATQQPIRAMPNQPVTAAELKVALQKAEEARWAAESRAREAEAARVEAETRAAKVEVHIRHLLKEIHRLTR